MQDPTKLLVYSEAEDLAVEIYSLTQGFPPEEKFGLTSQLRRAAVGVGSCIAEGCGRFTPLDTAVFFSRALSSCREISFQLSLTARLQLHRDAERLRQVQERTRRIEKMLTRLIIRVRGGQ